jgi:hypothetical protein
VYLWSFYAQYLLQLALHVVACATASSLSLQLKIWGSVYDAEAPPQYKHRHGRHRSSSRDSGYDTCTVVT